MYGLGIASNCPTIWTGPNDFSYLTIATIPIAVAVVVNRMPSLFSKLKLHRDHDHQKLETLKRHRHAKQEGKAASPLDPSMNLTTEIKVSSDATASSPNLPEQLWNKAYDQLKQKEPKLVDAYEIILSQTLSGDSPGYQPLQHKNSIEQMDSSKRRSQMNLLIQAGLLRTEKEAKLK